MSASGMIRRVPGWCLGVAVLLEGGWLHAAEAPAPLAASAPAASVVCLEVPDSAQLAEALRKSPVGEAVSTSPLLQSALTFVKAGRDLALRYVGDVSAEEVRSQLPTSWMLLVFDQAADAGDLERPGVALVGRLGATAGGLKALWTDRMLPALAVMDPTLQIAKEDYKGTAVQTVAKPGQDALAVAFSAEALVLGSPKGVRLFLDGPGAAGQALAAQDGYRAIRQRLPEGALATLFVDLRPVIERRLAELPPDGKEARDMKVTGLQALQGLGCSTHAVAHGFRDTLCLDMGDAANKGLFGLVNSRQPRVLRSAGFVPRDYAGYLAVSLTSGVDLTEGIRALVVEMQGEQAWAKVEEGFTFINATFAIDVRRDVIGQIGGEAFVAVKPVGLTAAVTEQRKPRWEDVQILGGLEVKDSAAAEAAIQRFLQAPPIVQQGLSVARETYKEVTIQTVQGIGSRQGRNDTRAYAFVGNFLLISRDAAPLKAAVDAIEAKTTLASKPGYLATTAPYSEPVLASLYLEVGPAAAQVLPLLAARAKKPGLQPLIPILTAAAGALGEVRVVAVPSPLGPTLVGDLALPAGMVVASAASLGGLGKPVVLRKVALAQERMKQIGQALRQYHRRNQVPPDSLLQLVPQDLPEMPTDPFGGAAPFAYGIAEGGGGWVLASVGPDGKPDVDVDAYNAQKWAEMTKAGDPESTATAKRLLYQFQPKRFADETGLNDEGDVVTPGTW